MSKVSGGVGRNPFGPQWGSSAQAKTAGQAESLGQQVQQELFGRKKPQEVPEDKDTAAQLARLHAYRKKLARLAGDDEDDYALALAEGTIAMIDASGKIFVGKRFLLENADRVDLLVGVLAHEIGHRPKRWAEHRAAQPTTRAELAALCRLEETYADFFAGRALAELGMSPEPLCAFLLALGDDDEDDPTGARSARRPHPEYFPAKLRADVIREGFSDGAKKSETRKKMFPELAKRVNPKLDLGSG